MTRPDYTALVFVIDSSGSMGRIHREVTGSLQALVENEAKEEGHLTVDTVFFDDKYEERDHFASVDEVDFTIRPRGMTALYDAIGRKITSFGEALEALPEDERPSKVLFVIATDGNENSSQDYDSSQVADLIKTQQDKYSWQITFLGANQDAVLAAQKLNIAASNAITFSADAGGVMGATQALSEYTRSYRSSGKAEYSQEARAAAMGGPVKADVTSPLVGDPHDLIAGGRAVHGDVRHRK
jgi:hypothetical protein